MGLFNFSLPAHNTRRARSAGSLLCTRTRVIFHTFPGTIHKNVRYSANMYLSGGRLNDRLRSPATRSRLVGRGGPCTYRTSIFALDSAKIGVAAPWKASAVNVLVVRFVIGTFSKRIK